ncbi:hypothetical protein ITP53_40205 [Nonomuraea sp. K274]|uniref:Histidine kinase/HSP90-like ATPase domain-containing protein n=1 Tax=Nonomuraea cypriaca TaxID=1187855 RepID=A0A931AFC3_9ACTN|nr:hypothetical protein [Nonomuraea cypriaca]MBF8191806.1 hypothetical protein [Nonomuraea cypriaca]
MAASTHTQIEPTKPETAGSAKPRADEGFRQRVAAGRAGEHHDPLGERLTQGQQPGHQANVEDHAHHLHQGLRQPRPATACRACIRIGVGTAGAEAVLVIEDDGPGLTPDEARKVFDGYLGLSSVLAGQPLEGHSGTSDK